MAEERDQDKLDLAESIPGDATAPTGVQVEPVSEESIPPPHPAKPNKYSETARETAVEESTGQVYDEVKSLEIYQQLESAVDKIHDDFDAFVSPQVQDGVLQVFKTLQGIKDFAQTREIHNLSRELLDTRVKIRLKDPAGHDTFKAMKETLKGKKHLKKIHKVWRHTKKELL